MAIKEILIFPQVTYSSSQGKVGVRQWHVDACEDLHGFIQDVCKEPMRNWNGDVDNNTVPVAVQVGPADDKLNMEGGGGTAGGGPKTKLLKSGLMKVVCQYQYLFIENCWPSIFTKPNHPKGTVLSMEVKGSGQFIMISPNGMPITRGGTQPMLAPSSMNRIVIPITEYHLTCDRMKRAQLENALKDDSHDAAWCKLEGTVNRDSFLGEPPGTMQFDTWSQHETFAPDPDNPVRYRLTAVLRSRQIWAALGPQHIDVGPHPIANPGGHGPPSFDEAIGWNWDYRQYAEGGQAKWGWQYIVMLNGTADEKLYPRYLYYNYSDLFCKSCSAAAEDCSDDDAPLASTPEQPEQTSTFIWR